MSAQLQMKLVTSSFGRIILHVASMQLDHKYRWHIAGILREIK
jgi:hypothetical protein